MARKSVEQNIAYDDIRRCYYVSMDRGRGEDGRRARTYRTYPTLTQARRALRAFQLERQEERQGPDGGYTLADWLEIWMAQVILPNRAETTVYGYRLIMANHLLPALGEVPLQQLSPRHLQEYYAMLQAEKNLCPNTVRRHHDLIACALHLAVRQDLLPRSPTDRVEPPRPRPREATFYSPQDLRRLYAATEGTWLELIVKLAGSCGLRREEICGLRWKNVDFARRRIHIREARTAAGARIIQKDTKNISSARTLYMTPEMEDLLRRVYQQQRSAASRCPGYVLSGFVAADPKGRPFSPNAVSLAFTRMIRREALPKITLHGLRHTFATLASAQGAPLFDIGKALGHSTPATTGRIYTHLLDQTHAHTLACVSAALEGSTVMTNCNISGFDEESAVQFEIF